MTMLPTSARSSRWRLLLLLPALLGSMACCYFQDGDPVRVTVVAILATEADATVDPKLLCIAREIQKKQPRLTGFELGRINCRPVTVGVKESFDLDGEQKATVTVLQSTDKDERVHLKVKAPLTGEITYISTCGKFFPIITRHRTKDDKLLILAIRVQPCPEEK